MSKGRRKVNEINLRKQKQNKEKSYNHLKSTGRQASKQEESAEGRKKRRKEKLR